jgi:hypothetical protein
MTDFLSAHGYDPGPTQRPTLAGCMTGIVATVPATPVLLAFDSLRIESEILELSVAATLVVGWIVMAAAGAAYGRIFQRAANDRRGGWLFGMAFGFLLWVGGAVMVLPAVSGGAAPAGEAAIGVFVALLVWGTALGSLFPVMHRLIRVRGGQWTGTPPTSLGPAAASHDKGSRGRR